MAKEIMRQEKVKTNSDIGRLQKHIQAAIEYIIAIRDAEIRETGHSDIIIENLHLNEAVGETYEDYYERLQSIIAEKMPGKTIRKDAVKMIDSIYTYSPEKTKYLCTYLHIDRKEDCNETKDAKRRWREEHSEWVAEYRALPAEEKEKRVNEDYKFVKEFAEACRAFHERYYGVVVDFRIHFHESSPHIHAESIPLVKNKNGEYSLNAKEIFGNKAKMSSMQTKFHEEVGVKFDLERGETRSDKEIRKHTTKAQKQLQDAQKELEKAIAEKNKVTRQVEALKDELATYTMALKKYKDLSSRIAQQSKAIDDNLAMLPTESRVIINANKRALRSKKEELNILIDNNASASDIIGTIEAMNNELDKSDKYLESQGIQIENDDIELE